MMIVYCLSLEHELQLWHPNVCLFLRLLHDCSLFVCPGLTIKSRKERTGSRSQVSCGSRDTAIWKSPVSETWKLQIKICRRSQVFDSMLVRELDKEIWVMCYGKEYCRRFDICHSLSLLRLVDEIRNHGL